ncbi:hypothetical protein TNCV_1092811 [Trichonephila clavipes]|nr:hypothetical protein TNCV_1092811 [Trichonephila clavipes]
MFHGFGHFFAVDRWRHDCDARRLRVHMARVTNEGRKVRSGYPFRSERMRVLCRSREDDYLHVILVLVHVDITPPQNQSLHFYYDEAHLWLNGYVNKQNCRIWSEANSQVYVETLLHPEKLSVWCALWAGGILLQKR